MNARVLLLMLVTGLFMAAWDGDQAAMQTALAKREQQHAARLAAEGLMQDRNAEPISTVLVIQQTSTEDAIPRPAGIAAGIYQAVNQSGIVRRVDVPQHRDVPPRDFYTVDAANGTRWYLIRVNR